MTLLDEDTVIVTSDEDTEEHHYWCCDPEVAFCGLDLSDVEESSEEGEVLVCVDCDAVLQDHRVREDSTCTETCPFKSILG